jgi:hypothetical protein
VFGGKRGVWAAARRSAEGNQYALNFAAAGQNGHRATSYAFAALIEEVRFASHLLVEERGFEPSVSPRAGADLPSDGV